ncbi:DUF3368 domain-containing protein [Aneurinibacillus aneurinilyticus]|jgi:predicted nucleic acid-binding protein|uniref:DUF3368 domain-containing protein n=1 Tax=Aneurinibacillus aneurinilyticus TaxID=1391 RepID=A0A848D0W4_ANEAE|nr:DUF3368 domain-containing protein [Aneurinibacillus aneurinilyticus]MCI1696501.1 DUF3368 domain-containing protein [Aneurinibacillus aneurinilyticus]NME99562.1 DUF3368 domain-containing protein [Aneurinibacillus aneurinilyticus]
MARIISNTSPLIALSKIHQLHLLWELYDQVFISEAVYEEIIASSDEKSSGKKDVRQAVQNQNISLYQIQDQALVKSMYGKLHKGELETIVGGRELNADFVLIDEKAARQTAKNFFLTVIGSIGILRIAKRKGKIEQIKPYMDFLMMEGYRISQSIYRMVLETEEEL